MPIISSVVNPWEYRVAPCYPKEIELFLINNLKLPSDINLLDYKNCFRCEIFKNKMFCFRWDNYYLYFFFEGYKEEDKEEDYLRKARAFFSENGIYPSLENGAWKFKIEKNAFKSAPNLKF